jgi:hypothetical protein
MENVTRLKVVAKLTYYLGWVAGVLAAIAHFFLGRHPYDAINLSKRNLFEASALFFLISVASELRSRADARSSRLITHTVRKEAPSAVQQRIA